MNSLPRHLKKYVVEQNYERYSAVDHAVWRFILRQLKSFLSVHAHECYLEGLEKTGIEIERIPKISEISEKLSKFGWRALPVSGFIPPAAFMELQSLGVLPIATDIRSLNHLLYTPAPDSVHEAAVHSPILINTEFATYLKDYSQVAKKSIVSKEDLEVYEAIRKLSDLKENPHSQPKEIAAAEAELEKVSARVTWISEAAELSRMNWWTAEYGLIGSLENPKIFGAGLLSSVGESRWCLGPKVKKIPLGVDCVSYSYDITEPQPQLFVTPDFKHLGKVLDAFSSRMAYRKGGLEGLEKALRAESVNSAQLDSGLQISGQLQEIITTEKNEVCYLRFMGPCQLSFADHELPGHGRQYHHQGFGTPLGNLNEFPDISPSQLSAEQWKRLGFIFQGVEDTQIATENKIHLTFTSGVTVEGVAKGRLKKGSSTLIITISNATVRFKNRILFEPTWGDYDMALGSAVISVFGNAADREAYGEYEDFVAARVPIPKYSEADLRRHQLYQRVRDLREGNSKGPELERKLTETLAEQRDSFKSDWLLNLEIYELACARLQNSAIQTLSLTSLREIAKVIPQQAQTIEDGISLTSPSLDFIGKS